MPTLKRAWMRFVTPASTFSQAEMLRAYAVQLHLKQIARLLRAARVETSRAVGDSKKIVDPVMKLRTATP